MYPEDINIPATHLNSYGRQESHCVAYVNRHVSIKETFVVIDARKDFKTLLEAQDGTSMVVAWYQGLEVFDVYLEEKDVSK
jgi:hypothetical protein